ncbi:hypothetical protein DRP05_00190 [Archaeoglobales archaeon]|nr:MAG: hypothetical protein DRP05_00190 [Archaeoglobales archaeon]
MKNNKKLILLVVLALLALGITLSGCSSKPESKPETEATPTPTETQAPESESTQKDAYAEATEIPLSGDAKDIDAVVRPILNDVYGGAKPTSFVSGSGQGGMGAGILYVVKRTVKAEDMEALKNAIESKGYKVQYSGIESDGFGIMFIKGQNEVLMIGGTIGEQEITVGWSKGQ